VKVSWAYTPGCSGPAPTFFPFYNVYSTHHMLLTMTEKTHFLCPKFPCRMKFISDSWRLKHSKLHHPERLQVARQGNKTIRSAPLPVKPTQRREFNATKDSVEYLDSFPYLDQVEKIADLESQPPPPSPLPWMDLFPSPGAPLIDYIAEPWKRDA